MAYDCVRSSEFRDSLVEIGNTKPDKSSLDLLSIWKLRLPTKNEDFCEGASNMKRFLVPIV